MAYFDAEKLEKVFFNLISNAFKHTPKGGKIIVNINKEANSLIVTVEDNGDGMETNELNKIFNQFHEIEGKKNYGQFKYSSGIGLAIVKSIVQLHKGTVSVKSKEGEGSLFKVSLPLSKSHYDHDEIFNDYKESDYLNYASSNSNSEENIYDLSDIANTKDENKYNILIVEDNEGVATFIKNILTDYYNVVIAENGLIGYQNAISKSFNLIISDMMMPEMDGLELCSKLKGDIRTSHIPFILLSARTSLVHKYEGLESGADDYLFKPFEVKELLFKCRNIINTHDKLKEKFVNSNIFQPSDLPVNSMDENLMNKAFLLVKENISNEFFSIDEFARGLGVSRSLLFTKVKAWTNQTPNDFVLSIRIKQAATMIELGTYNIAEISYKVGFKDPSYFSKIFKKHLNVSPKVYSERFKNTSSL